MTGDPPLESWRLYFPFAVSLGLAGIVAWGAQLAGMPMGLLPSTHGAFLLFGMFGAGVQGFLFTAYAKQNDAPLPGRAWLFGVILLQAAAALAMLVGATGWVGAAIVAAPWIAVLAWVAPVARASLARRWDATTASVPVALFGALVGAVLHVVPWGRVRGVDVGMSTFVVPMALAVLDRVLPFFSSRVTPGYDGGRRPGFLPGLFVLSWAGWALASAGWSGGVRAAAAGSLALLLRQWWGWRPWPAARTPMIAVLHVGVGWIAVAWALAMFGAPDSAVRHAMLVGGLGSLFFGISMRVVRGHAGMPVVLGRAGAALFLLVQAAAVLRVGVALGLTMGWGLTGSAALLAAAFGVWLLRFGPVTVGRMGERPAPGGR